MTSRAFGCFFNCIFYITFQAVTDVLESLTHYPSKGELIMLNLTRENVMINIRTMAVSALGSLRSEVLPQWEERAIELRHDAAALRDALVIRFSKDPKAIYSSYSPWEDWAMDAHTTQCAEDNARIHRRLGWLDKAFDNRLKARQTLGLARPRLRSLWLYYAYGPRLLAARIRQRGRCLYGEQCSLESHRPQGL